MISQNLNLYDSKIYGNTTQYGNISLVGNLDMISQNLNLHGSNIYGNTTHYGNISLVGNLDMISQNLNLHGSKIYGNISLIGNLDMNNRYINGNVIFTSNVVLSTNIIVGNIYGSPIFHTGIFLNGNLDCINQNLNLNNSIINGNVVFTNNVILKSNLDAIGSYFNIDLCKINGNITFNNNNIINAKGVSFNMEGSYLNGNINTVGNINTNGNITVNNKLNVLKEFQLNGNGSTLTFLKVGTDTIPEGVSQYQVVNNDIDGSSNVFVTLTGNTPPQLINAFCVLIDRASTPKKFTIVLNYTTTYLQPFNYMIVNNI
jgi:hypothetical protein